MTAIPNSQRALWTFLGHTLVGPFLAAVVVLLLTIGSGVVGKGPPSLQTLGPGELLPKAAGWALTSYVWSAVPAALAGLAMAVLVWRNGRYGWLEAAVAAAIAVAIAAYLSGGVAADHITPIAVIASLVGVTLRLLLVRANIIADGAP